MPKRADKEDGNKNERSWGWLGWLLGLLIGGGLFTQLLNIRGELGSLSARHDATSTRVDRIANRLPDLAIQIAEEELRKPIRAAVLVSKPYQHRDLGLVQTVSVVSSRGVTITTVPITGPDLVPALVERFASSHSPLSLKQATIWDKSVMPNGLIGSDSFVLRERITAEDETELTSRLKELGTVTFALKGPSPQSTTVVKEFQLGDAKLQFAPESIEGMKGEHEALDWKAAKEVIEKVAKQ